MTDIVKFKNTPLTKAIIALLAGSLSAVATAQTSEDSSMMLEEVVVTAERREANLQDVPISITAFSATDLADLQVWNLGDLQSLVPNLSIHVGDANNAVVYIRGVGQVDSVAFFEPGVGIYLDDVYLGRAQGAFLNVLDVERIEVLRGPQGTLYGRNTVGGAVKYISKAPTNEFEAEVETTFGNYNRVDLKASIGGAMVEDKLFGRLTVAQLGRDGYSDNVFDGKHDGDQDTFYARGVLRYDASDDLSIQIAADYTNSDPDRSRTPAKVTPINILVVDPYTFGLSLEGFPADEDPFLVMG